MLFHVSRCFSFGESFTVSIKVGIPQGWYCSRGRRAVTQSQLWKMALQITRFQAHTHNIDTNTHTHIHIHSVMTDIFFHLSHLDLIFSLVFTASCLTIIAEGSRGSQSGPVAAELHQSGCSATGCSGRFIHGLGGLLKLSPSCQSSVLRRGFNQSTVS